MVLPTQIKGVLERLRLAGMPEEDIQRLRSTRSIQTRFTIKAPIDGVITAFDLRTGMNISKDKVVAQIREWTRSGSALQCQNLSPIC